MATETFDPQTAPLEELKARANAGEGPQDKDVPMPRNEDGTFKPREETHTNQEQEIQQELPLEEEEETIYQRRIDLGDGSGVQVFQGNSMEELVDKLVTAQENATKKIRQLAEQVPKITPVRERTDNDEFIISQQLMSEPTKAFEQLFQDTVGMPITEFKTGVQAIKAFNEGLASEAAAEQFVQITPDYNAIPANGRKIHNYLKTYSLPGTLENITKAYTELRNDGLLIPKPAEGEPVAQPVAQPVKKHTSGLPSRGGTVPVAKKQPATQADFERETAGMTLAQIRAKANNQTHVPRDPWDF